MVLTRSDCWSTTAPISGVRHVELSALGDLLNQNTFYWGTLEGVSKVYMQVIIDTFCSLAFAGAAAPRCPSLLRATSNMNAYCRSRTPWACW
jgi:hypothetical protein